MRILGIDPGYALLGYGVIDTDGHSLSAVDYGVVETKSGEPFPERLERLFDGVSQLVEMYHPDCAVFEELFFYHNITTAISVSAGRGVAILAAQKKRLAPGPITAPGDQAGGDGQRPCGQDPGPAHGQASAEPEDRAQA